MDEQLLTAKVNPEGIRRAEPAGSRDRQPWRGGQIYLQQHRQANGGEKENQRRRNAVYQVRVRCRWPPAGAGRKTQSQA